MLSKMIILKELFSFQNVWFKKFGTSKRSIQVIDFETVFSKFVLILRRPTHHLLYFSLNCIEFGKPDGTGEQEMLPGCIFQVSLASSS